MARHFLRIAPAAIFVLALIFIGKLPAHSDSLRNAGATSALPGSKPKIYDASYRSHSSSHKVIVEAKDSGLRDSILAEGGRVIEDYGSFALMSAPGSASERVATLSASGSSVRDDMNMLLLRAGALDTTEATTEGEPLAASSLGDSDPALEQLYLVQFVGPIKKQWVNRLRSSAEIVSYIPNNAYLIRASAGAMQQISNLKSEEGSFVQWTGDLKPGYRIAPEISLDSDAEIISTVQFVSGEGTAAEIQEMIARTSASIIGEPTSVLNYTNVRIKVRARALGAVARMPNVAWIEPWSEPELLDEKQDLILAGKLNNGSGGSTASYISWLQSIGVSSTPDFVVDVTDSGIDRGSLDPFNLHKDFLDASGLARVAYARFVGELDLDLQPADSTGHGTLNASIVGGYNVSSGFPFTDSSGYHFGLGVHPFVRLGITQIFAPDYSTPPIPSMVDRQYRDGARISNNSWGAYNNLYTADSQLYDSMVRDARPSVAGNQELAFIFSSGNRGEGGHLTVPGNAKNVLTVGASENLRPGTDGCNITSDGADDINSLIFFSSGGPTADGRRKPEICAPGTHIQGARSLYTEYNGSGVCGPPNFPSEQALYTWSSGTSHSAPAVAGGAALVRQLFQQSVGHAPSPAMLKAYLTNSATYMTGWMAGDSLPGNNQGWGLMSLGRALDGVPRILVDQDKVLSNTGQVVEIKGKVADPSRPFRVTLAWTDAPGNASSSPYVNDLNLQVEIGGKTYLGNQFGGSVSTEAGSSDPFNNVEAVWAPQGASGDFTVRVVAANLPGDGVPGNSDLTDQDFALVIYNAGTQGIGGGGGGSFDSPPGVALISPLGNEQFLVGSTIRIRWSASDDKGITSQRVEFSPDGNAYSTIATLDGNARNFDWRVPGFPTTNGRIRVTVLDGVNLPVSTVNAVPFEIMHGPPDLTAPTVTLLSHNGGSAVGGGLPSTIKWRESDNVGVLRRVIELSTDKGSTFHEITTLIAPSSGDQQTYEWPVPADLSDDKAKLRITVYDDAGNSAQAVSQNAFEIWPMPIINSAIYFEGDKAELQLSGRNFRIDETEIWVDGVQLKKIRFDSKYFTGDGMSKKVSSVDKKLHRRFPDRTWVKIEVRIPTTGQISPQLEFKRKIPLS